MLLLNSTFQDLSSYGSLYFVVVWKNIDFDELIVWYYVFRNQNSDYNPNQNQNSDQHFQQFFSPIWFEFFDVLWCGGLKVDFCEFFITQLEKSNVYELFGCGEVNVMNL